MSDGRVMILKTGLNSFLPKWGRVAHRSGVHRILIGKRLSTAKVRGSSVPVSSVQFVQNRPGILGGKKDIYKFENGALAHATTGIESNPTSRQGDEFHHSALSHVFPSFGGLLRRVASRSLLYRLDGLVAVVLPQSFGESVPQAYFKYIKWYFVGAVASSLGYVNID